MYFAQFFRSDAPFKVRNFSWMRRKLQMETTSITSYDDGNVIEIAHDPLKRTNVSFMLMQNWALLAFSDAPWLF